MKSPAHLNMSGAGLARLIVRTQQHRRCAERNGSLLIRPIRSVKEIVLFVAAALAAAAFSHVLHGLFHLRRRDVADV